MRIFRVVASAVLLAASVTGPASACPVCDQPLGKEVRAGIFDEHFVFNLLSVAFPFGIFLGMTAAIHGGFPRRQILSDDRSTSGAAARGDSADDR